MTAASLETDEPDDSIELLLTEARNRLPELAETTIRDGVVYLTRYGRRLAAIVPVDVAENYERMENAYLSALADEADAEAPLPPPSSSRSSAWHDLHRPVRFSQQSRVRC